jgi:glycosyltransferase involved in cell wall biosynthesis
VLIHAGTLYRKRDPRPILRAVAQLTRSHGLTADRFRLRLVGATDPEFQIEALAADLGVRDMLDLVPKVPRAEALRLLGEANALLLVQPGTDLQVPGKLFEYMQFGLPIVSLSSPGATSDIVRGYGLGVVVDPGDIAALAAELWRFVDAHVRRTPMVVDPTRALQQFDGQRLTGALAEVLRAVGRA